MRKILVTGAKGQVGQSLQNLIENSENLSGIYVDRNEFDLTKTDELIDKIIEFKPDAIINAAAYTKVDLAEENLEQAVAFSINAKAVGTMAKACKQLAIPFIHYSTDYVYHNGLDRPLKEHDPKKPQSVYAQSKLAGEQLAQENCQQTMILRTSWVYHENGINFVKTMLDLSTKYPSLKVVNDQIGTPTYAADIADVSLQILAKYWNNELSDSDFSIYNFSNEGVASWYDFAQAIFEYKNIDIEILPVDTSAFPRPAARPNYSILEKKKIRKLLPEYKIPHWREALKGCLNMI